MNNLTLQGLGLGQVSRGYTPGSEAWYRGRELTMRERARRGDFRRVGRQPSRGWFRQMISPTTPYS